MSEERGHGDTHTRIAPGGRYRADLLKDSEHVEPGAFLDALAAAQAIERHALHGEL